MATKRQTSDTTDGIVTPSPDPDIAADDYPPDAYIPEPEGPGRESPAPLSPDDIQALRREIMQRLYALGCTPKTKPECEDAVMTFAGLVLAPENFPLIAERLRTILDDRAAVPKPQKSLKDYVVEVHGKTYVRFVGLLNEAHGQGLASLSATFISVTESLALARATATFKDGRTFTECGDATPANVTAQIKPHFARMALTRAKARVLRDALNIDEPAAEELEG